MIIDKVKKIINDVTGIEEEDLGPESELVRDLNIDQLDLIQIVMQLEDQFDIEIPDDELLEMDTIGDLVKYLEGKGCAG